MGKLTKNKLLFTVFLLAFIGIFVFLSGCTNTTLTGQAAVLEGTKLVTKVLDGDTVIIEGGYSVRLLGIDADERGYPCYGPAKQRLEELVLNKEVYLEADKENQDQYNRYLRYLILEKENMNLRMVKEGFAIARFSPENEKYREEIITAEKEARENKVGCKSGAEQVPTQPIKQDIIWSKLIGDAIGACNAGNYYGVEKIIEGKIIDGFKSKTNTVFLNFEKAYPNQCFTAVIFSSDLINFPEDPQNYYQGKLVRVKGKIKEYNGKPEIVLKDSSQIEIGR